MERDTELHDKAWKLLEEKGLKLGQMMMVRSSFVSWSGYKEENPFIERTRKGDEYYYHSTHKMIENYMFDTEEEVVLANAIYLNMNEGCGPNDFVQIFKYACRLMGLSNKWT